MSENYYMTSRMNEQHYQDELQIAGEDYGDEYILESIQITSKNSKNHLEDLTLGEDDFVYDEEYPIYPPKTEEQIKKDSGGDSCRQNFEKALEQYYNVVEERSEIRRKNICLQKKLTEHYLRRRMDHVFKEDQKGLDMQGKYLRRLYEYDQYKKQTNNKLQLMKDQLGSLHATNDALEGQIGKERNDFWLKQKKTTLGLKLKTGKRIPSKVMAPKNT